MTGEGNHDNANIPLAFILTIGAGAASAIGGAVVFHKRWVRLASHNVLAGSLAASAGVMMYVSFVELLSEAVVEFEVHHPDDGTAVTLATLCFFLGVAFTALLGRCVHLLDGEHSHDVAAELRHLQPSAFTGDSAKSPTGMNEVDTSDASTGTDSPTGGAMLSIDHGNVSDVSTVDGAGVDGAGAGAGANGNTSVGMAGESIGMGTNGDVTGIDEGDISTVIVNNDTANDDDGVEMEQEHKVAPSNDANDVHPNAITVDIPGSNETIGSLVHHRKKLRQMGLLTALAIGIHNLPEGLTTFVATLASPSVGAALAVAIAIHNVPEGVCVAVPIFFSTGKRMSGFLWSLLAAVAEPLGALIGYIVIKASADADGTVHADVYGALFAVVAGIMVFICVQELIPMALQYDKSNTITTKCIVGGMLLMAVSLVLFDWT